MPIPLLIPPEEERSTEGARPGLHLVPLSPRAAREDLLIPRTVAHSLDLMVVGGISIYFAKFSSLMLVSLHMPAIQGSGRMASKLFRDAFVYGQGQLTLLLLGLFSFVYFVLLPYWSGRTLGLGLLGLRVETESGGAPGLKALTVRFVGCVLVYATAGLMLAPLLKRFSGTLFQDRLSNTRIAAARH